MYKYLLIPFDTAAGSRRGGVPPVQPELGFLLPPQQCRRHLRMVDKNRAEPVGSFAASPASQWLRPAASDHLHIVRVRN